MKLLLFLCLPLSVLAQSIYDSIPVHEYKFSYQINAEYSSEGVRVHRVAQDFSYIGQDAEALQVPNEVEIAWGFDTLTEADRAYFEQFKAVNAVDYLIERSAQEQIMILNEAHHKPRHRVFVRQLLQGLYDNGYRYFGLEVLLNSFQDSTQLCFDSLLQERGYPLCSPITGTYTVEPQMANLIRDAIQIGYTLFAYERTQKGDREFFQAQNIKRKVLDKDPDAKILLHCGWYHILEDENRDKSWMAKQLQEMTGINPFTVYQDMLIERWVTPESPFFTMMHEEEPSLFINDAGEIYNGKKDFKHFDALLYHPRTRYIYNRPDWLLDIAENQIYQLDNRRIKVGFPCLIKAYRKGEMPEAVPIDIIEKESAWDFTALVLPPGEYRLEILNISGQKQEIPVSISAKE